MIPARMGSNRLKMKNLALINKKPMISYAIEAAKASGVFNQISINSESDKFENISKEYDINFYRRSVELSSSTTKSDDVIYDFMKNTSGDITVWVNSTSPLQTGEEIKDITHYFIKNHLDTLITIRNEQVHCVFDGKPLNFNVEEEFAQTQDLKTVGRFVYSIMMWKNEIFMKKYEEKGHALFCGKVGYYPVSKETSLIVKFEEDLSLIEAIIQGRKKMQENNWKLDYSDNANN